MTPLTLEYGLKIAKCEASSKGNAHVEEISSPASSASNPNFTKFPSPPPNQIQLTQQKEAGVLQEFRGAGPSCIDLNTELLVHEPEKSSSSTEVDETIEAEQPPTKELVPAATERTTTEPVVTSPAKQPPPQPATVSSSTSSSEQSIESTSTSTKSQAKEPVSEAQLPESNKAELPLISLLQLAETTPAAEPEPSTALNLTLSFHPQPIRVVPAVSTALVAQPDAIAAMLTAMTQLSQTVHTHIINTDNGLASLRTELHANLSALRTDMDANLSAMKGDISTLIPEF